MPHLNLSLSKLIFTGLFIFLPTGATTPAFASADPAQELPLVPSVTTTRFGDWHLFCKTALPKACILVAKVQAAEDKSIWTQVLFTVANDRFEMRIKTPKLLRPTPSILVDGLALATLNADNCDETACNVMIHPDRKQIAEILKGKELVVTMPLKPDSEEGLPINLDQVIDGIQKMLEELSIQ